MWTEEFFSAAPDEIKQKTYKAGQAFRRFRKAEVQLEMWRLEKEVAAREWDAARLEHQNALNRWDPDKNQMMATLEEAPKQ